MRASSDGLLSLSEAQRILSCLDEPFKEPGMSLSLFIVLAGDFWLAKLGQLQQGSGPCEQLAAWFCHRV